MNPKKIKIAVLVLVVVWCASHIPGIIYGTQNLPLHQSYVGDEQSPVNGAFHILEEKSLLGLRNVWTVYYGPIFSIVAVPAVLYDAGIKYINGEVRTAEHYKNSVIFDWGKIVVAARFIAVIFSVAFLFAIYYFLKPNKKDGFFVNGLIVVILLASNYFFFEYSHFFKNWIFAVSILGSQWLSLKKILDDGKVRWWVIHGAATIFAAGISYVSLGQLVMWLPVLIGWIRHRNWQMFIPFARLAYSIGISMLLIILWHPIILFRYFSMVGVGSENVANTFGQQNPVMISAGSLAYYGTLIVLNLLPLIVAGIILLVSLWRKKIYARSEFWIILLPGVFYFVMFGPAPHHEGRYMLPTIISLVILIGFLFVEYKKEASSKFVLNTVYVLFGLYLIFHLACIGKWIHIYSQGPIEKEMLSRVLERSKRGEDKVLLVQNYIAGHVHTREAYAKYARDFNKEKFDLYKEILKAPLPQDLEHLNATYVIKKDYESNPDLAKDFDQVVVFNNPRPSDMNQFDFVDEKIYRIWKYWDVMPSYTYIK